MPPSGPEFRPEDEPQPAESESHRQLSIAARRSIRRQTPSAPAALRRRIESLPTGSTNAARSRFRWIPAAAAAVLVLAALSVAKFVLSHRPTGSGTVAQKPTTDGAQHASEPGVPVSLVSAAIDVHRHCSALKSHFVDGRFPRDLKDLPGPAREFLGCYAGVPDLSAIGYQFAGAAPCTLPGGKTLHVLYRSVNHPDDCISLFLQDCTGQINIDPDKAYTAAGPDQSHPMVVWQTDDLLYCLVGDAVAPVEQTASRMGMAVKL